MRFLLTRILTTLLTGLACISIIGCAGTGGGGSSSMGGQDITTEQRQLDIAAEPTGNFYYGRRYFVSKTRFWGYVRQPRQPWSEAKLVIMNEGSRPQPDRLPEDGPYNARHGFDQNFDYKLSGSYTGRKLYDPASNLFLPEFRATAYQVLDRDAGWIFSPKDSYHPNRITLVNKSVAIPKR